MRITSFNFLLLNITENLTKYKVQLSVLKLGTFLVTGISRIYLFSLFRFSFKFYRTAVSLLQTQNNQISKQQTVLS